MNGNNLTTGGVLKNNVFPEDSRRYCGIGYAYAAIPKEIVTANIVGNVCQKFYQTDETGRNLSLCAWNRLSEDLYRRCCSDLSGRKTETLCVNSGL